MCTVCCWNFPITVVWASAPTWHRHKIKTARASRLIMGSLSTTGRIYFRGGWALPARKICLPSRTGRTTPLPGHKDRPGLVLPEQIAAKANSGGVFIGQVLDGAVDCAHHTY